MERGMPPHNMSGPGDAAESGSRRRVSMASAQGPISPYRLAGACLRGALLVCFCLAAGVWSAQAATFVQVNAATPQSPQTSVAATYVGAQTAGNTNILAIGWNDATSNITS